MRILQVVVGYHPARGEFGGIVETVEHLSEELVRRGHEVEVWTSALLGRGRPMVSTDVTALRHGVTLRYFATFHPRRLGYGFALSPSFGRAVLERVRDFDVVHVNGYRNHFALSAMLAAHAAGVPYVVQPHGTIPPVVHRRAAKRLYDRVIGDRLLRDAGARLAISRAEAEMFGPHGVSPDDVDVVYNGIDTRMMGADLGAGDWFRRELGVEAPHVLLYVGRLHERKGLQHLVTAFARLAARRDDVHLAFVGADDGYEATLRQLVHASGVAHRVTLAGPRYGLDKYRAYRSAAVVAYPAVHEYFGLVPFEGLMCGAPAVVTAGEGAAEVLEQVGGGWTAPYGDALALARTLEEAIEEREQRPEALARRVEEARGRILDRFTWHAVTDGVLGAYERACGEGR